MREAEVERHAALAFLFPAIGIGAGQCLDERRFSVIDVAGGADDVHLKKERLYVRRIGLLRMFTTQPNVNVETILAGLPRIDGVVPMYVDGDWRLAADG